MWLPHVGMTRHSNASVVVNRFVFTGEGLGLLCLLDPVLTLQQVAQNQISLNLCSLPRWVNSVMETSIFTELLQYTWHDLSPRPVTGTCYCTQGWVYCRGNLLPTVFRLFYKREKGTWNRTCYSGYALAPSLETESDERHLWDTCIPRPLAKGSPVRTYVFSTPYLDYFILQEVCTLSLATEFAGDKMTTVNFFGLVLCLMGISVHVVTKATRGGWLNYSITYLMSGNLTSLRYKCQFLINM